MTEQAEQTVSLTLARVLAASPAELFDAWTDPDTIREWLAPGACEVEEARADASVGGEFYVRMRTPEGERPTVSGIYRDVVAGERVSFTWCWEGSDVESLVTVVFRALDAERTEMTLLHERFPDRDLRDKHDQGWTACLAKLEARFAA